MYISLILIINLNCIYVHSICNAPRLWLWTLSGTLHRRMFVSVNGSAGVWRESVWVGLCRRLTLARG